MNRILALALLLPVLAACRQAPAAGGSYSTGGDPDDAPCARVVSAIGYAELLLKPAGQEDAQHFEDAVLGRLAEVRGITLQFGPRLPASLGDAVRTVEATTESLSTAAVPRPRQVALLKEYRTAAERIERTCG
ncbi:hypothetical protein OUY22_24100 [Nonomuraea sp. MCN248]|uniref:Lipoprotein n=1 Tax=Nonomuraea corallina TaxID=2989783 RepID=A0ABT4SH18_9ACTN|nr:hypothetical protein [Nonomuraea corallina]MDA0636509.1 hypothetical protein [Nonomuraea corallina]